MSTDPQQAIHDEQPLSADAQRNALELLERARNDPYAAQELERLRDEVFTMLADLIRETGSMIPLTAPDAANAGQRQLQANSVLALRNMSRNRESISRQRNELAEAMVMGALLNRDNPDWDPLDPATDRSSRDSLIFALMQMPPPDTSASE